MRAGIQAWHCAALTLAGCLAAASPSVAAQQAQESGATSITDVPGVLVGQHTLLGRPTGCTVVLAADGATGGVDVRGGAPGTRETALLDPVNTVQEIHAVVLSVWVTGGFAPTLSAAIGRRSRRPVPPLPRGTSEPVPERRSENSPGWAGR